MFVLQSNPFIKPFLYFFVCFKVLVKQDRASIEISNNLKEHSLVNT